MHAAVRGAQLLAARLALRQGTCSVPRALALPQQPAAVRSTLRGSGRACAPLRARRHASSAASRCAAAMAQAEGQRSASASAAGGAPLAALEEQLGGPLGTEPQVRGCGTHARCHARLLGAAARVQRPTPRCS
jgi:hypothetical protein